MFLALACLRQQFQPISFLPCLILFYFSEDLGREISLEASVARRLIHNALEEDLVALKLDRAACLSLHSHWHHCHHSQNVGLLMMLHAKAIDFPGIGANQKLLTTLSRSVDCSGLIIDVVPIRLFLCRCHGLNHHIGKIRGGSMRVFVSRWFQLCLFTFSIPTQKSEPLWF